MALDCAEQIVDKHLIFWDKIVILILNGAIKLVKLRSDCARICAIILIRQVHKIECFFVEFFLVVCVQVHPLCKKAPCTSWWLSACGNVTATKMKRYTYNHFHPRRLTLPRAMSG